MHDAQPHDKSHEVWNGNRVHSDSAAGGTGTGFSRLGSMSARLAAEFTACVRDTLDLSLGYSIADKLTEKTFRCSWVRHAGEPLWIKIARAELGIKAIPGYERNSPRILEYVATFPYLKEEWADKAHTHRMSEVDETAWCACFVNWCLLRAGKQGGPSAKAEDWLAYGTPLTIPRVGAITIVYRRPQYHVAFYTGGGQSFITLMGGNQSHAVSEKTYTKYWKVMGYRWPK